MTVREYYFSARSFMCAAILLLLVLVPHTTHAVAVGDYIDKWSTGFSAYTATWDGSYLWINDGTTIRKFSANGTNTGVSFALTAANNAPSGIAWDGTYFWVMDSVDKAVYKYNAAGVYQNSYWALSSTGGGGSGSASRGIVWDGTYFWVVDYGTDRVYQYNSSHSYTGTSFDLAGSGNGGGIDITWDGTYFWVTDYVNLKVYQYDASGVYQGNWSVNAADTGLRGIASNSTYFFVVDGSYIYRYSAVVDNTPPTITNITSSKANGTYPIGTVIPIDLTFSEAVTATSSVTVTLETGTTDRTCTFTVSDASSASCNYTVQAGDESSDLTASSVSGYIQDQLGNAMTNFVPTTNLAANKALVIDGVAPTASTLSPADGATNVAVNSNLVIDFNETVNAQSGNITLKNSSDDSTVETFDVTSDISGSGTSEVTVNPSSDLAHDTSYYVQIDASAFDDASGNSYAGISDTTTWNFTTASAPVQSSGNNSSSGGGVIMGFLGTHKHLVLPGDIAPHPQIIYPDGHIEYLDITHSTPTDTMNTSTPAILASTTPIVAQPTPVKSVGVFPYDLRAGMTDSYVLKLQQFLNKEGFILAASGNGSPGNETDYFGPLTYNALVKFQEAHAQDVLDPVGLSSGTGFFGPETRAFANAHIMQ